MMTPQWPVKQLSPLALAFIGDAVWEVYARNHVMQRGIRKPGELHSAATSYVRAKSQAQLAQWLFADLTPAEQDMLKRGRNAKSGHARKNAEILEYRHSTGFETLIGYLYGSGQNQRLDELCEKALALIDERKDEARG